MRFAILSCLGSMLLACGGAQKPAVAKAPARVVATPAPTERRPYAELAVPSAERAPEAHGVWIQLAAPSRTWAKLPALVQALPPLAIVKDLIEGRGGTLPPDVAAVVDPAQPVDFILPLGLASSTVPPTWAFRVRSPQAVLRGEAGLTLRRVDAGVWDMGAIVDEPEPPANDDAQTDQDEEWQHDPEPAPTPIRCQLVHLPPPIDYRVLCARGAEGLTANSAFLLAPARLAKTPNDLHVELGGKAYAEVRDKGRAGLAVHAQAANTPSERTGQQIATDVMDALLDHDLLTFDFSLGDAEATAQLDLVYGSSLASPALAKWLEQSSQAKLPLMAAPSADANVSNLGLAVAGLGDSVVKQIIDEASAGLDEELVASPSQRADMVQSMRDVIPHDGRFSLALGFDTARALAVLDSDPVRLADEADKPLAPAAVEKLQVAMGGWGVIGVETAPEPYLEAVKRAYRVANLNLKTRPGKAEKNPRTTSPLRGLSGAPRGLPPNTLQLLEPVRPVRKYVPPTDGSAPPALRFDVHILLVPDGDKVWIVFARSEALAVERAQSVLHRTAPTPESFPKAAAVSLLLDIGMFQELGLSWDSKHERDLARAALHGIDRTPRHGKLGVPFLLQVVPREGTPGWRLRLTSHAHLDDLLTEAFALVPPSP